MQYVVALVRMRHALAPALASRRSRRKTRRCDHSAAGVFIGYWPLYRWSGTTSLHYCSHYRFAYKYTRRGCRTIHPPTAPRTAPSGRGGDALGESYDAVTSHFVLTLCHLFDRIILCAINLIYIKHNDVYVASKFRVGKEQIEHNIASAVAHVSWVLSRHTLKALCVRHPASSCVCTRIVRYCKLAACSVGLGSRQLMVDLNLYSIQFD